MCIFETKEEDNQIFALKYSSDGSQFVTAGKDATIRLYDEETKIVTTTLTGHSNRVFASCFTAAHPQLLVSGGWDSTVRLWDLRSGRAEAQTFGLSVCSSHALDTHPTDEHLVLAAPSRSGQACALLDLRRIQEPAQALPLAGGRATPYACAFDARGDACAVGGAGSGSVSVFSVSGSLLCESEACDEGVYGVRWSEGNRWLCCSGKRGGVVLLDTSARTEIKLDS
jgi:WD40 repeat protein